MFSLGYIGALLFSLVGLLILDYLHSLAFFKNPKATAITLAVGVAVFLIWDFLGVGAGIFFTGDSTDLTGLFIAPNVPVEEVLFLVLLGYSCLVIYGLMETTWERILR